MRNIMITGLMAGAAFSTAAVAQMKQPPTEAPTASPTTQTPPATQDPMADPMAHTAPDSPADQQVVDAIDNMAGGEMTAEQQAQHDAWPAETQTYYASLTPQRQQLFWQLRDADKVALSQLPEAEKESTWQMIEQQAQGMAPAR
ncbi:hypothetical protein [Qipengyuania spongiae]|uniref:DUF3106 domain-containing protein n=1 Tax=Qipengyuania spongiae TaxID=2909673 RepID=A0ABY5SWW0_9SPHN|nr:hypothetical protein [Qipengyuania spongiae]UVI38645.1 hypothetical protein L1F33_10330 [Qipengyuania spongiae]